MKRKPWATKEWKLQRDQVIADGSCAWCSSKENLIIHHQHITRAKNWALRRKLVEEIIKKQVDSGKLIPLGKKGRLSKEQFRDVLEKNEDFIVTQLIPEPDYSDISTLNEKGEIAILCTKCHFALHHHMRLCPKCKKKYTKYTLCFSCHEETKGSNIAIGHARTFSQ